MSAQQRPRRPLVDRLLSLCLALMVPLVIVGCAEDVGACVGTSSLFSTTFCKNGWTEGECQEWDTMEVNGASWFFHSGQTCEERGLTPTP